MKTKTKFKVYSSAKQGSILAYALIIIASMLAIAASLSVSSVLEKKGASGTEFSMQSLQTADSGVQLALKNINAQLDSATTPGDISDAFGGAGFCTDGKVQGKIPTSATTDSTYELTFLNKFGTLLACNSPVSLITNIKSVGTYKNTVRAVSVSIDSNRYIKLLLHNDGLNNVFVDSETIPKSPIFAGGDVTQSASQSKFGGRSAFFDGNGDYLMVPESGASNDFNFGSSPFTIDGWFYDSDLTRTEQTFFNISVVHVGVGVAYNHSSCPGKLSLWASSNSTAWDIASGGVNGCGSKVDIVKDRWYHFALVRNASSYVVYIDGVEDIKVNSVLNVNSVPTVAKIGWSNGGINEYFNGYIDEFRISKGVALWSGDFVPPSTTTSY